jgi:hypothetical protein
VLHGGSTAQEASGSLAATAQPRPTIQTSQMISGNTVTANGPGSRARQQSLMVHTEPPVLLPRRISPVHGTGAQPGQTIRAGFGFSVVVGMATEQHSTEQYLDRSTMCGCTSHNPDARPGSADGETDHRPPMIDKSEATGRQLLLESLADSHIPTALAAGSIFRTEQIDCSSQHRRGPETNATLHTGHPGAEEFV